MGLFDKIVGWIPGVGKIGGIVDDAANGLISGVGGLIEDAFDWGNSKIINPVYDGLIVPVANKTGQVVDSGTNAVDTIFGYLPWIIAGTVIVAVVIPMVMK